MKPVALPAGVTFSATPSEVRVKGPKGELRQRVVPWVSFKQEDGVVRVVREAEHRQARANHGLMRALLQNMVTGVSQGFERRLEIVGVGYKAELRGRTLTLTLGYSHPIEYSLPEGIEIKAEGPTKLVVKGIDKEKVGQVAAEIRRFRPPDSYKGKGVRYEGEYVRLKVGKAGQ